MTVAGCSRAFGGRFRVAFVVFGALAVLQGSPTLDAPKVAYLAGSAACLAAALLAVWRMRRSPTVMRAAPWLVASAALAVLIALSFVVARAAGTSVTDWLRDAATYGLFASLPVFALDAQGSASRRLLVGMLVAAGILGGLSWAVEWLGRREILELPYARLLFPSAQLPAVLYVFALAAALAANGGRLAWAVLAGITLGILLVTGTRSALLLLVAPVVMAAVAGWDRIGRSVRTFAVHGVAAIVVVVLFQATVSLAAANGIGRPEGGAEGPDRSAGAEPGVIDDRFTSLPDVLTNPTTDASFRERVAQYAAAWSIFVSSPVVGVGPGHAIDWVDISGNSQSAYTADTPLVMPAKFGILGIAVFAGFAGAYVRTARDALRRDRRSAASLALVGFATLAVVGLPLGFLVEDKGTSLALILLLALAFGEATAPGP